MGASILGMWTPMASSSPLEVVLLTGYYGPSHWEETRFDNRTDEVDGDVDELWSREEALRERRTQLTQETWVEMMKSTDFLENYSTLTQKKDMGEENDWGVNSSLGKRRVV